jgi:hypothetical protein
MFFGPSIGVSQVALLISAAFWAWLWGPIGLVLAAPLTACLAVLGRYVPHLEFLDVLLGEEPPLETPVLFYQRLLAKDQDEAMDIVEEFVKNHAREDLFEQVLLPALILAKTNKERGDLAPPDEEFIHQVTQELLEDLNLQSIPRNTGGSTKHLQENADEKILIFGCPARDSADELALAMLRHMLGDTKCIFEILSANSLCAEVIARIQEEAPAVVIISVLPPKGFAHTRYLCKRLRSNFPDLKILVGYWGLKADIEILADRLNTAGADLLANTLQESRNQLIPLIQTLSHVEEKKVISH